MLFKTIIEKEENFSRSRNGKKGWAKSIDDLNRKGRKNGYALVGDWINQKDELKNGLYIDASSKNGKIVKYNLFSVKEDDYNIIRSIDAQQGWVKELWEDIDSYLINERASFKDLLAHLKKVEINEQRLANFGYALQKSILRGESIMNFDDKENKK